MDSRGQCKFRVVHDAKDFVLRNTRRMETEDKKKKKKKWSNRRWREMKNTVNCLCVPVFALELCFSYPNRWSILLQLGAFLCSLTTILCFGRNWCYVRRNDSCPTSERKFAHIRFSLPQNLIPRRTHFFLLIPKISFLLSRMSIQANQSTNIPILLLLAMNKDKIIFLHNL